MKGNRVGSACSVLKFVIHVLSSSVESLFKIQCWDSLSMGELEKAVDDRDMKGRALQAYLRQQQLRKEETNAPTVKEAKKKPQPKKKLDLAAIKARYMKRKKDRS